MLTNNNRNNLEGIAVGRFLPRFREFSSILITFSLTVFAWIFFRAANMEHAISYIGGIFSASLFTINGSEFLGANLNILVLLSLIGIFLLIEWIGRNGQFALDVIGLKWRPPIRYAMYYLIIIAIFWFGGKEQEFIYFQF